MTRPGADMGKTKPFQQGGYVTLMIDDAEALFDHALQIDAAPAHHAIALSIRRFTLSHDGQRIRAAQGHSLAINLDLPARTPPETLWNSTFKSGFYFFYWIECR